MREGNTQTIKFNNERIMNKIQVRIKKWSTHFSVKIFDQENDSTGNNRPRVRTSSSQSYLDTIMKEEGFFDCNEGQFRFNVVFQ